MMESKQGNQWKWIIILVLLFLVLSALESSVLYHSLTRDHPGANDFFVRWYGAKVYFFEGRDPYSLEVIEEIQPIIGVDASEVGRGGFAYPFYVVFTFFPLIFVKYGWAQAIWVVLQQWVTIGLCILLVKMRRWKLSPLQYVLVLLLILSLYPVARSIFLGQFTLIEVLFLAGGLYASQHDRDFLAGILIAGVSIKPQMVVFILPIVLLWNIKERRWRFFYGLASGGIVLLISSLALFPSWIGSFLVDLRQYKAFAGGRNPLVLMLETLLPAANTQVFYWIITIILVGWLLWRVFLMMGGGVNSYKMALYWAIFVELFVLFQTGTTNYVLFLLPLVDLLYYLSSKIRVVYVIMGTAIPSVLLWWLFLKTIEGNEENVLLFLPIPIVALFLMVVAEVIQLSKRKQIGDESGIG